MSYLMHEFIQIGYLLAIVQAFLQVLRSALHHLILFLISQPLFILPYPLYQEIFSSPLQIYHQLHLFYPLPQQGNTFNHHLILPLFTLLVILLYRRFLVQIVLPDLHMILLQRYLPVPDHHITTFFILLLGLHHLNQYNRMMIYKVTAAFLLLVVAFAGNEVLQPVYTEDLQKFEKDNKRGRMQMLLGCWFMARQYNYKNNITGKLYTLELVKKCMQKITRKESVVKITSLVGKNLDKPKIYEEIINIEEIPLFQEALYPTTDYEVTTRSQQASEYDKMIMNYIASYQKDLQGITKDDQGAELKKRLEDEITKRQKYYFGIIPANKFTSMLFLITIAIALVIVCTCWKKYKLRTSKEAELKQKEAQKKAQVCPPAKKRN